MIIVGVACIFLVLTLVTGYKIKQRTDVTLGTEVIKGKIDSMSSDIKDLKKKKKALDRLEVLKGRFLRPQKKFKKWSAYLYELSEIVPRDKMWLEVAEWSVMGFETTGSCKEDVVKQFSENGAEKVNFKNMKYSTRQIEELTTFKAWIRNEKSSGTKTQPSTSTSEGGNK